MPILNVGGGEFNAFPMPEQHDEFRLKNKYEPQEMERIRQGLIPEVMEDHWLAHFTDNKLYIYRSWSGVCRYIADFSEQGIIKVTVNRDPQQYTSTSISADRKQFKIIVNKLILNKKR